MGLRQTNVSKSVDVMHISEDTYTAHSNGPLDWIIRLATFRGMRVMYRKTHPVPPSVYRS